MVKRDSQGNWHFDPETVKNTQELITLLMKEYGIPIQNVIRHFDVTGKHCPEPYVRSTSAWNLFVSGISGDVNVPTEGIAVGSSVFITGTNYATGTAIGGWVKNVRHTVSKILGDKALLGADGGINSWVYLKDLKL